MLRMTKSICLSNRETHPEVTVVVPCFNRAAFVALTLESALAQTYPAIHIVAVDDGSTDGTRSILDTYSGRIQVLEHPNRANKGQSASINRALDMTDGQFVAILDSDDLWAPDKLSKQVAFLQTHETVGLVYGNGFAIDHHGNYLYKIYPSNHIENSDPERVLLDCYFHLPSNALMRRSVLNNVGSFDEDLRSAQDHDMAIRMAEAARLGYIDEILFYYRRHRHSISSTTARVRWENGFAILSKAMKRYPYSPGAKRQRLAVLHFRLGQCLFEEGEVLHALRHFVFSGVLDPLRSLRVLARHELVSSPH